MSTISAQVKEDTVNRNMTDGFELVNLTPHEITILSETGARVASIPPSGSVARLARSRRARGRIGDVPISEVEYGGATGVPDPMPGVRYIVSLVTALAVTSRDDLLAPWGEVRNKAGRILGCRGLQRVVS